MTEMEDCLLAENHKNPPLDCLTCPRRKLLHIELVFDKTTPLGLLVTGHELAMWDIGVHLKDSLTEDQKNTLEALQVRFCCAIDRGLTVEYFQDMLTEILKKVRFKE